MQNLTIARSWVDLNNEDSALYYLNLCLAQKFYLQDALIIRARIYANKKNFEKALIDYNSICNNWVSKEALYFRGVTRHKLSQFSLAIDDLLQALKSPVNETQIAIFRIEHGTNGTTGITTMGDIDADIWNMIGLCYLELKNYNEAIQALNEGININEDYSELYINRALAYEQLNKTIEATLDYELAISKDPNNSIAKYNLAKLNSKYTNSNLVKLSIFIEENPFFGAGYAERGMYFYEDQQFESAISDYERALELQPGKIEYIFNLALAYGKYGDENKAIEYFIAVTKLYSKHTGALFNLGNLHFKAKYFNEAISFYSLALINDPPIETKILYNRALAYHELKMQAEACSDMIKVGKMGNSLSEKYIRKYCITY